MFNLRHVHAPLLLHLLRHQLLLPHQLDVEAQVSSLQQVASKESSPQEVGEVPGTTHVLHQHLSLIVSPKTAIWGEKLRNLPLIYDS